MKQRRVLKIRTLLRARNPSARSQKSFARSGSRPIRGMGFDRTPSKHQKASRGGWDRRSGPCLSSSAFEPTPDDLFTYRSYSPPLSRYFSLECCILPREFDENIQGNHFDSGPQFPADRFYSGYITVLSHSVVSGPCFPRGGSILQVSLSLSRARQPYRQRSRTYERSCPRRCTL